MAVMRVVAQHFDDIAAAEASDATEPVEEAPREA